jgi:hypothetical protein
MRPIKYEAINGVIYCSDQYGADEIATAINGDQGIAESIANVLTLCQGLSDKEVKEALQKRYMVVITQRCTSCGANGDHYCPADIAVD